MCHRTPSRHHERRPVGRVRLVRLALSMSASIERRIGSAPPTSLAIT